MRLNEVITENGSIGQHLVVRWVPDSLDSHIYQIYLVTYEGGILEAVN